MSTPLNLHVSVLATLMESHFKELDLNPEELLLKREEMIPILEKCLSHSCMEEGPVVEIAAEKSDPTDPINPSYAPAGFPIDSTFLKDCVAQTRVANNKSFIKIVHGYLVEAGKDKEAEEYLKKVTPVSLVQTFESIKMWNYHTLLFKVFKVMEDMGLGEKPLSFEQPPLHLFPTPALDWKPGQTTVHGNNPGPCLAGLNEIFAPPYEAGIVPEMEDGTSTAVEPNPPADVVLHVGEDTTQSMMDAAPDNKKKGVMEVEETV